MKKRISGFWKDNQRLVKLYSILIAIAPFIFGCQGQVNKQAGSALRSGGTGSAASVKAAARRGVDRENVSCRSLRVMARVYMAHGEYDRAQPLAEKALSAARQRNESKEEQSLCLLDLAYLYGNQNRFSDAEQLCKQGISLQKKIYYEEHPYIAYGLRTLSSIYDGQGRLAEAKEAIEKAMSIMRLSHPADDGVFAPFQADYAKLLVEEDKLTEAEEYYKRALNCASEMYGPEHLYTATILSSMAELYILQKRYDEARELVNKSQAIQERIYGSDNHMVADVWLAKAKLFQMTGKSSDAQDLMARAIRAVQKGGNKASIARVERRIEDIRSAMSDARGPVAKIINS